MKKKAAKKHRRRVQRYLDLWTEPLGLAAWHTTVAYYRSEEAYTAATGASVNRA